MHALPGLCTLNIFEYEISLGAGNLEIITGSLCLDMATLSIGADLWGDTIRMNGQKAWHCIYQSDYAQIDTSINM